MDTSDPEIGFDIKGECSNCAGYDIKAKNEQHFGAQGEQELAGIIKKIKSAGKNSKYDCVIGISGGVDSTYVAYKVREFGLRPLAVHLDNGWNSELAVSNIEKTLKTLGIDLYTHVIDWEEFKDLQLAFFKASIPNLEIPTDHAIIASLYAAASKYGIRYILTGGNVATEGIMPKSWIYDSRDYRLINGIHRRFGSMKLSTYPHASLAKFFYYSFVRGIRVVRPLNYLLYNKQQAIRILEEKLGWRSYQNKHFESIITRFFQGYILPKKFGFDKRRAHYSTLICSGQMTRDEALGKMGQNDYPDDQISADMEFFCKKLELSQSQFNEIMGSTIKNYSDYPSNSFIFLNKFGITDFLKKITSG